MSAATRPMTLAAALQHPQQDIDEVARCDLALTATETAAAGRLWLALLWVPDDGSDSARAAWAEVVGDPALIVALHWPAAELLHWWRRLAWEDFGRDGDGWAWAVLDRLRAASWRWARSPGSCR